MCPGHGQPGKPSLPSGRSSPQNPDHAAVKRYRAYDPPEYLDWSADPELVRAYVERLEADPGLADIVRGMDDATLLSLYRDLLRTRLHDIGLKRWVKQGVISKAWLGTGEEASTVGPVRAVMPGRDVVMPMIRNAAACFIMGMPLADMFRAYLATEDSPNGGRDLHVGDPGLGVFQPISHMGTNAAVMTGVALAFRNRGEDRVALTWVGDGATRTGICHEGVNLAAVQQLPVIFIIQNNQVALGTRVDQHTRAPIAEWGRLYGIHTARCDGNNVLEMYAATRMAVERCRAGDGPAAIIAETFRMGGHATHDEREARQTFPDELFSLWGRRDPIGLYEEYLVAGGVDRAQLARVESEVAEEVDAAAAEALESRERTPPGRAALFRGISEGDPLVGLRHRLDG